MKKSAIIMTILIIGSFLLSGCVSSSSESPKIQTVATKSTPNTQVKLTESNEFIVIDLTNNGNYASDYYVVVNFYDGKVKVGTFGTHITNVDPGTTARGKIIIPSDANNYDLDGVATTIGDKMYKIEYTLV